MAFKLYVATKRTRLGGKRGPQLRDPVAKFSPGPANTTTVLLIVNTGFVDQYGFASGDRFDMAYDDETEEIGIVKNPDGKFIFGTHGNPDGRTLHSSVTRFLHENEIDLERALRTKSPCHVRKEGRKEYYTFPLAEAAAPRRRGRPRAAATA